MISAEAALSDYEKIVAESISSEDKMVKIMRIMIKLLLTIRTNQVGGVKKQEEKK